MKWSGTNRRPICINTQSSIDKSKVWQVHFLFDSLLENRRPKVLFSRSLNRLSSLVNLSEWIEHLIKRV